MRRPEFDPVTDGPDIASAEALQSIAIDLERIADALEEAGKDPIIADGGEEGDRR